MADQQESAHSDDSDPVGRLAVSNGTERCVACDKPVGFHGGIGAIDCLIRLDHRRAAATWDGTHDPTGADHLEESTRFADLGQRLYEALLVCLPLSDSATDLRIGALAAWETRP